MLKRIGQGLLALFVFFNVFMFLSAKLNEDHIPGIGKWKMLSVLTGSMSPTILAGDMVVVKSYGEALPQEGDIITFWQDESRSSLITHRVIDQLSNGYVQTKGDANQEVDGGWTGPEKVLGKVVIVIPYAAWLQDLLQEPFMLAILIIGLLISSSYIWYKRKGISDSSSEESCSDIPKEVHSA